MPGRRRNRRGRGRRGGSVPSEGISVSSVLSANRMATTIVRIPFREYFTFVPNVTTNQFLGNPLTPNLIRGRLNAIAPEFEMYRFTSLRFALMPTNQSSGGHFFNWCIGYYPSVFDTQPPTTFGEVIGTTNAGVMCSNQTVPTNWVVPRRQLLNQGAGLKWWKVVQGSESNLFGDQGSLYGFVETTAGNTVSFVLDGVCEFSVPVFTGESLFRVRDANTSSDRQKEDDEKSSGSVVISFPSSPQGLPLNRPAPVDRRKRGMG